MSENGLTKVSAGAKDIMRQAGFDDYLIAELAKITDRHAGYSDVMGYVERLAQYGKHMISMGKSSHGNYPILHINHMLTPMAGLSSGQCNNNVTNLIWDLTNTWIQDVKDTNLIRSLRGQRPTPVPALYSVWSDGHATCLMDLGNGDPKVDTAIILDPNSPRIISEREYIAEGRRIDSIRSPHVNDLPFGLDGKLPLVIGPVEPRNLSGFFIGKKDTSYYVACFYVEKMPGGNIVLPALKVLDEQNSVIAAVNSNSEITDDFQASILATLSRFEFTIDPAVASDQYFSKFNYELDTRSVFRGYGLTKKL